MTMTVSRYLAGMICISFLLIGVYAGLVAIFSLCFVHGVGQTPMRVFFGIDIVAIVLLSSHLCYLLVLFGNLLKTRRSAQHIHSDERTFAIFMMVLGMANCVWFFKDVNTSISDDFSRLPHPGVVKYIAFALICLTTTAVMLVVPSLPEIHTRPEDFPLAEPSMGVSWYTPQPARHRDRRVSTTIVAVQHGSPPEMWAQRKKTKAQGVDVEAWVASLGPQVPPTPDPRSRPLRPPPPILTSSRQWYVVPGSAV